MSKSKKRTLPQDPLADLGTPERARRGELTTRATATPGVLGRRARHECRLDWYSERACIDDREYGAGLRFRTDWLLATARAKLTSTYGPRLGAGREDFHALQLAARGRIGRALAAVRENEAAVLVAVCGCDEWASGRLPALRRGLNRLADHYGMPRAQKL